MKRFEIVRDGEQAKVALCEKLTEAEISELHPALKLELAAGVREIAFDMAKTLSLDSSGLGLLIATGNSLKGSGGAIRLENVAPDILNLFRCMRLDGILNVTSTAKDAPHG